MTYVIEFSAPPDILVDIGHAIDQIHHQSLPVARNVWERDYAWLVGSIIQLKYDRLNFNNETKLY